MIAFIRTVLFYIVVIIVMCVYSLVVLLSGLFLPFEKHYHVVTRWPKIVMKLAWWIIGVKYEVKGAENIPHDRSVVYLVKHQSTYETFFLPWYSPRPIVFIYKESLEKIPIFGWCLASLKNIPIDRDDPRVALKQIQSIGSQRVHEGRNPIVFPEGTRVPIGKKGRYRAGGAMLARSAGVSVLPVAHNAGAVWPKGKFTRHPGTVTFSFGPEIETHGLKTDEIMKRTEEWIENEVRILSPEYYQ